VSIPVKATKGAANSKVAAKYKLRVAG